MARRAYWSCAAICLQDIAGRRSFEWLTGLLWQDFVDRPLGEEALRRDLGLARERAFAQMSDLLPATCRLSPLGAVRMLLAARTGRCGGRAAAADSERRCGPGSGDPHP